MHEYVLFSQIPAGRHNPVLQILAGVTASQPTPVLEQTLIYQVQKTSDAPNNSKKQAANRPATAQNQRPAFYKLVRDVSQGDTALWTQRVEELPAAGVKEMISRAVTEQVAGEKELEGFRQTKGAAFKYDPVLIAQVRLSN